MQVRENDLNTTLGSEPNTFDLEKIQNLISLSSKRRRWMRRISRHSKSIMTMKTKYGTT
jgi:hypothetical protein